MKPLLSIAFAVALIACNPNQASENQDEKTSTSDKPIKDGEKVSHYSNGQICSIIPFKNGKENGKSTTYYRDGKINFIVNFKDGKKDGKATWYYSMGQLYQTRDYKNDQLHGWRHDYIPSGLEIMKIPYEDGHVLPGGEELTLKGKPRKHPEIEVGTQNSIFASGKFTYSFKLSESVSKVVYYVADQNGKTAQYWDNATLSPGKSNNTGIFEYYLAPGQFITEKIKVYAHFTRVNGYEGVVVKNINVALSY